MQVTVGPALFGIEFIDMECWKCNAPMFGVTGMVLMPPGAAEWPKELWASDDWLYLHYWKLASLPEATVLAFKDHVASLAAKSRRIGPVEFRLSKTTQTQYWVCVCRSCRVIQGSFPMEEQRFGVVSDACSGVDQRAAGRLIYRPWRAELSRELLEAAADYSESSRYCDDRWGELMGQQQIWIDYFARMNDD